jgi:phosphate transport system substrate-binding protein
VHYRTSKVSTVTLQESTVIRKTTTNRLALFSALVAVPFLGITAANAQVTLDKNVTVSGQGSTFVSNFMEQCKSDAKNEFGINIAYQPTGSGAGRTAYIAGTNDFGGSDVAFPPAEKEASSKKPFVYIPVAVGGIAVIYKVPGVTDLKLSAPTLAGIFVGKIQSWNNEAIARDNPGASLPNEVIRVVVRSDSSGTSNVFSDYLATAGGGAWKGGATSNFPVPAGNGIAQRGSDGVSNYVAGAQGNFAITYAETSFAEERKLTVAKVINTARQAVAPDAAGVTDAMAGAAVNDDGSLLLNFNVASPKAYPISTTAYLIAPQQMDKAKGDVLRTFLTYALTVCQEKATKVGYAPLPENIAKLGLAAVDKINAGSGAVPTAKAAAPVAAATTTAAPTTAAPTTVASATTAAPTTKAATPTETSKKKKKTTKKK